MKYLFITNDVGYSDNANSRIILTLCDEFNRSKHEIYLFSISQFVQNRQSVIKQYPVYSFGPRFEIAKYSKQFSGFRDILKMTQLLYKPQLWISALRVISRKMSIESSAYFESLLATLRIRIMNKRYHYDRIIAVCEPGISMSIAARLKHHDILIYQLDPFHSNATKKPRFRNWRLNIEMRAYRNAKAIFLTKLIEIENRKTELAEFETKWTAVDFPLICQHTKVDIKPTLQLNNDKINCLYCGTLNIVYRNPKFALEIAKRLGDDYRFYFIGLNCVEVIENAMSCRDKRIICLNPLSSDQIYQLMDSADFLVNIGNTMTNQMPSKIIDYISTGKPILNIAKSRMCPTLDYTARYPLCLDVFEDEPLNTEALLRVDMFCRRTKGQSIPFDEVKKIFYDCTPRYVAGIIARHPGRIEESSG